MSIRFSYIMKKPTLTEKDEKYLLQGLDRGVITSDDILTYIAHPTTTLLNELYNRAQTHEEALIVAKRTPFGLIKNIDNLNYVLDVIRVDYNNFNGINFSKFRTQQTIGDYAHILSTYEATVATKAKELKNYDKKPLTEEEEEELGVCDYILNEMRDSFDTASLILSGRLDPKTLRLDLPENEESESEPNA